MSQPAAQPIGSLVTLSGQFDNDVEIAGSLGGDTIIAGQFQTVIDLSGSTLD